MNFSFNYGEQKFTIDNFTKTDTGLICDLGSGVFVKANVNEYSNYNAKEWVLWFENNGENNSRKFSNINDCDLVYKLHKPSPALYGHRPVAGFPCITAMRGIVGFYCESDEKSSQEFNTFDEYIYDGAEKSFKNNGGRSSDGIMPFFDLHTKENGIMFAIGWSGSWKVDFKRDGENVSVNAGLQNADFYIKPGEKLRTASVLVMEYSNEGKYNKFRSLILNHFSHTSVYPHKKENILAFELWGSVPSEIMIQRINELKNHDIKFDEIWMVYTNEQIQLSRLMKRDNIDEEEATLKINSQLNLEEKIKMATRVLYNNGDLGELEKNLELILRKFRI